MDSSYSRIQKLRSNLGERIGSGHSSLARFARVSPSKTTNLQPRTAQLQELGPSLDQALRTKEASLQSSLKQLALKKQQEVRRSRSDKEPVARRISEVDALISKLTSAYSRVTETLEQQKRSQDSWRQAKLETFEDSLEPLHARAADLAERQTALTREHLTIEESKGMLENLLCMYSEENLVRLVRRAESIAHREEMEETLDQLKAENPLEFEENAQWDLQNDLLRLGRTRNKMTETVRSLKLRISKKETKLRNLGVQKEELQQAVIQLTLSSPTAKAVDELEKFEVYLDGKAQEHQTPFLDELVVDQLSIQGLPIETAVLKTQLQLIQEFEAALTLKWKRTEVNLKTLLHYHTAENNWDHLETLEDELHSEHRTYQKQRIAIGQWIQAVTGSLKNSQKKSQVLDQHILDQFKGPLLARIEGVDGRKAVQHLINVYTQKLKQRESTLQEKSGRFMQKAKDLKRVQTALSSVSQSVHKLSQEFSSQHMKLSVLASEEKALANRVPPLNKGVAEEAFGLQEQINYWTDQVDRENAMIESVLKPGFHKAKRQLTTLSQDMKHLKFSHLSLNTELNAVHAQIEAIRLKIRESTHVAADPQQFQLENEALSLFQQLTQAKCDLEDSKTLLADIEAQTKEALTKIEQEEARTHAELKSVQASMQESPRRNISQAPQVPQGSGDPKQLSSTARSRSVTKLPAKPLLFSRMASPRKLSELVRGDTFYKKFADSLKQRVFDPLNAHHNPPEACGYGKRELRLTSCMTELHIKHGLKLEKVVPVSEILRPIIPERTMKILKEQKRGAKLDSQSPSQSSEDGIPDSNWPVSSQEFKQLCRECSYYQLSIALQTGGRIDLVANNYPTFKVWVQGLNALVRKKCSRPPMLDC